MSTPRDLASDQMNRYRGIKHVTATAQLDASDHIGNGIAVFVTGAAAVTLTLPPMAEAIGKSYFVRAVNGISYNVSVVDYETATEITTYGDMDANNDHAIFFCDGQYWIATYDGIA